MGRRPFWAAYLAIAIGAELILPIAPAVTGVVDAAVLVLALSQFGWAQRSPLAVGDPDIRLLPVVALLPLLRVLSLVMPVPALPPIMWIALAGAPLLLAVAATARLVVLDVRQMGLTLISQHPRSVIVAVAGIPIGLLLSAVAPSPLDLAPDTPLAAGAIAFVLVSCAAVPEELIFRGMLQPLIVARIGGAGILVAGAVYAATYVGTGSLPAVAIMAGVGLLYGWETWESGSLWSPITGHAALLVTATLIGPALL